MSDKWTTRKRPARLERRFEFSDYEETRQFLELTAELSEERDYYPDMSFGRTHVSMTLQSETDEAEVTDELIRYAGLVDAILPKITQTSE